MQNVIGHYKGKERGLGRRLFWCAALVAGLLAATYVSGCARHHRFSDRDMTAAEIEERMDKRAERVLKAVDATPEQRERVLALIDGLAPEMVKFRDQRKALKDRFKAAVEADTLDTAELDAIRLETKGLVGHAVDRSMEVVVEVSKVLTPEQRKKLIESWGRQH